MSAASDLVTCLKEEQEALDEVKRLLPHKALEEAEDRKVVNTSHLRTLANQSKVRKANYMKFKELAVKTVAFKVPKSKASYTLHRIVRNDEPGFCVKRDGGEVKWIPDSACSPAGGSRFDRNVPRATWAFDFKGQRFYITYDLHQFEAVVHFRD